MIPRATAGRYAGPAPPGGPPGAKTRPRLELVHRNALRLLRLVNTLLDFSRLESGHLERHVTPVDLGRLTRELASGFEDAAERAALELIVDSPDLYRAAAVDIGVATSRWNPRRGPAARSPSGCRCATSKERPRSTRPPVRDCLADSHRAGPRDASHDPLSTGASSQPCHGHAMRTSSSARRSPATVPSGRTNCSQRPMISPVQTGPPWWPQRFS